MAADIKQIAQTILGYLEESEWAEYQQYRAERQRFHAIKLEAQQPVNINFYIRYSQDKNSTQDIQNTLLNT